VIPSVLLKIVRRLPESVPIADLVPARTPHKQHWIGWLEDYDGPGGYSRRHWDRDAAYIYNHLHSPGMLIWLSEAGGVTKQTVILASRSFDPSDPRPTQAAAVRTFLPWPLVERHIIVIA
jgi:hypothetical protein